MSNPTPCHLFSFFCPTFSVFDLQKMTAAFGYRTTISRINLEALEMNASAAFLAKHYDKWQDFLRYFSTLDFNTDSRNGCVVCWGDENFPHRLKRLAHPPAMLFYRGPLEILEAVTLAVVGARHPTHLGRKFVHEVADSLARKEVTVISGGARGIDEEAHLSAMNHKLSTAVFLPGGVDKPYPRSNYYIFENVLRRNGLLISEYPPSTEVRAENFYRRNRLIAGGADVVLIVEAAEKSGTMMTARTALRENIEIMVVPGSPLIETYQGSLQLLFEGAPMALRASDVLNLLAEKNVLKNYGESPTVKS